jgi:hypothetical protein
MSASIMYTATYFEHSMCDAEQDTRQPETVCDLLDFLGRRGLQGNKLDSVGLKEICWLG